MGNRIRELREEKQMTQLRLSIELEVSQEAVSAYENGKHYPSVSTLLKLSAIFHASCDYILGLSDIRFISNTGQTSEDELKKGRTARLCRRAVSLSEMSYHQIILLPRVSAPSDRTARFPLPGLPLHPHIPRAHLQ